MKLSINNITAHLFGMNGKNYFESDHYQISKLDNKFYAVVIGNNCIPSRMAMFSFVGLFSQILPNIVWNINRGERFGIMILHPDFTNAI